MSGLLSVVGIEKSVAEDALQARLGELGYEVRHGSSTASFTATHNALSPDYISDELLVEAVGRMGRAI
ncbi:MAG: hypothetical protein DCC49_09025 [Acidobacteria bacterium]|nr:MAG: hypothetical protein DCC49_09025 [Acidobacteriota bacterium]